MVLMQELDKAQLAFQVADGGLDQFLVTRYRGTEGLCQLYRFEIDLTSTEEQVAFDDIVGKSAKLSINTAHGERWFHGIVSRFEMTGEAIDQTYFREFAPDLEPELYFKVFRRKQLVKSTRDTVIVNAKQRTDVTIEIETAELPKVTGTDRISARQVFKTAEFVQQSDFGGVWREGVDKIQTRFRYVSDMVIASVKEMDVEPIQVKGLREREVIDQDVDTAQKNLKAKGVAVAQVKPYDPKLTRQGLKDTAMMPEQLKEGQEVILYQHEGQVRYYTLVPRKQVPKVDEAHLNELKKELTKLKSANTRTKTNLNKKVDKVSARLKDVAELSRNFKALQKESEQKDKTIAGLKKEVAALRAAHQDLLKKVDVAAITRMAADIKKLQAKVKK